MSSTTCQISNKSLPRKSVLAIVLLCNVVFFFITIGVTTKQVMGQGQLTALYQGDVAGHIPDLDRPPSHEEVYYGPADGEQTYVNPPAFNWIPAEGVDTYIMQYSRSRSFDPAHTTTVRNIDMTVHIPMEMLEPGTWYWRYGYTDDGYDRYSRARRFEIPEKATAFPYISVDEVISRVPRERPRVYFTPELVDQIRSDTTGKYDHLTRPVIEEAEQALAMDEELFKEPLPWEEYADSTFPDEGFWSVYRVKRSELRPFAWRMQTVAQAYLYTGDMRFAEEARRRLMHFATWDVDGPSSALWPTAMGMDLAQLMPHVFDWIYDILSDQERRKLIDVIGARMEQINKEVHRARPMEARPFRSHPGRMVGFAIEGAIVLAHEDARARDWLDYTLRLMWSTYPAWGGAPGGWQEGPNYWASYMGRIVPLVIELDRLGVPLKDKPFFRNTGWYGLYAAYPGRPSQAFGDSQHRPVSEQHGRVSYGLSSLYGNPWFRWHAEQTGSGDPSGPAAFSLYDPDLESRSPADLPQSRLFEDVGYVAMHSNMADPENNVMLFFQSNPYGAVSHNHASQNAFVIEAWQEPLTITSGYREAHGTAHHRQWIRQTKAHNSILVDNEGQPARDRTARGTIIEFEEHGDYVYATGDATEAYSGRLKRFHRHVLFLRPDVFVIIDDLETDGRASTFQWLLHAKNEIQVDDENRVMVSRHGKARLIVRLLTPGNLEISQTSGFDPPLQKELINDPEIGRDQYHLTATTLDPASSKRIVSVMQVEREEQFQKAQNPSSRERETTASVNGVLPNTESQGVIRTLDNRGIGNGVLLEQALNGSEQLDAEGGIALRVGDDLILWKETGEERVRAAVMDSEKTIKVIRGYFR